MSRKKKKKKGEKIFAPKNDNLRQPGIEPEPLVWKTSILTIGPSTLGMLDWNPVGLKRLPNAIRHLESCCLRRPGIEPEPLAWKASILTIRPSTPLLRNCESSIPRKATIPQLPRRAVNHQCPKRDGKSLSQSLTQSS